MENEKKEMSLRDLLAKCKDFKIVLCDDARTSKLENGEVIEENADENTSENKK